MTACGGKDGGVRMGSLSDFDSLSYSLGANIGYGMNHEMRDIPFDFKAIDKGIKEGAMGKATQEHDKSLDMLREYFMSKRGERAQEIAAKRAEQDSIRLAGGDTTKVEYPAADPAMFESEEERAEISYAFGNDIGYNISQSGMPIQLVWIGQAMQDVRDGKAKMAEDAVNQYLQYYFMVKRPAENAEASKAWLEKIEKKSGVKKTESGLLYKVTKQGDASMMPKDPRDVVKVHYTGRTREGKVFDTSKFANRSKEQQEMMRKQNPDGFNEDGTPVEMVASFPPAGTRRMGANPHANGGLLLRDLRTPDFRDYAVDVKAPGAVEAQDMYVLGTYVRDVMKLNLDARNFRIFAPDETASNRLQAVFEVTGRRFLDEQIPNVDEDLDPDGRVMDSMLSEHFCEGFLEGYLLTGRHGFFDSYEAFIRIVDSMFSQHAKWLKMCSELPWRQDIASLNYILASNVWQQDHNGFTHQDPGFLDHAANKKADVVRIYLPPDANCLLSCFDHCIKSRNYVNIIVASKHPRPQWLTMEQAVKHCTQGIGIWQWASTDRGEEPDIVMACCGDTPTLETLAAVTILRGSFPELKIRVVNVVDLMRLQSEEQHPHGLSQQEYDAIFTSDKPIIFAFHGYPSLIHELTYRRHNKNIHVRGYIEEGTITTPFDMRVLNRLDRFNLVMSAVYNLPQLGNRSAYLIQQMKDKLVEHRQYISSYGVDMPEVANLSLIHI